MLGFWNDGRLGESADKENELPALILGQAISKRGHGLSAFGDLVIDCAVGDGFHVLEVGEIGGRRIVHHGFGAVAFAVVAVAFGAVVVEDLRGGSQVGWRGLEGVLEFLDVFGDSPDFFLLIGGVDRRDAGEQKERSEKDLARFHVFLWGHGGQENSRISEGDNGSEVRGRRYRMQRYDYLNSYDARKMSQRSSPLKKRMAAATNQAITVVRRELANSPILARSPVN